MRDFKIACGVFLGAVTGLLNVQASYAGAIGGTTGAAVDRYDVTVTKVELCRSSVCSNPYTLGSGAKVFDIASAAAGGEVGKFIDLSSIPMYQTWSHVRVTMSTTFTISADDGTCQTRAGAAGARGAWTAGAASGGAQAARQLELPNQALVAASIGGFTYSTYGIDQTDGATSFTMTIALSSPYQCKGEMPKIEVKFDTSEAFGYTGGCAQMFPQPPTITITATDP